MNPFTFGNPIKDPARFHGRESEMRQIVNRLLSSAHMNPPPSSASGVYAATPHALSKLEYK